MSHATLRLMKKAYAHMNQAKNNHTADTTNATTSAISAPNTVSGALTNDKSQRTENKQKTKWLKKNEDLIRMMLIILVMFIICWYPLILLLLVLNVCRACFARVPLGVLYLVRVLVVVQYVSNSVIYLVKIKEFRRPANGSAASVSQGIEYNRWNLWMKVFSASLWVPHSE